MFDIPKTDAFLGARVLAASKVPESMPTIMFQCKSCLSIIRSREAYVSHVREGRDVKCHQCPAAFKNICDYQVHKFNEHLSCVGPSQSII